MDMFSPELRENRESMFEARKLTAKVEREVKKALETGKEFFPDVIICPVKSCGMPIEVEMKGKEALLTCKHCGWKTMVRLD